jgi:hypothetical protein
MTRQEAIDNIVGNWVAGDHELHIGEKELENSLQNLLDSMCALGVGATEHPILEQALAERLKHDIC